MPLVSKWDDVPDDDQQRITKRMGDGWDASARYGGPLVMFHGPDLRPEKALPAEVVERLDQCHDGQTTLVFEDKVVTVWYHLTWHHLG